MRLTHFFMPTSDAMGDPLSVDHWNCVGSAATSY
jgi:hypothetical protein